MNSSGLDDSVIDLEQLTVRCMGRMELVERILTKFNDALGEDLSKLEQAMRAADTDEVARHAHRINGSAATVSALRLQQCAGRLQSQAEARELVAIERSIQEMRAEYSRLSTEISSRQARAT